MDEVKVNLADNSYSIYIQPGSLCRLGQLMQALPCSKKTLIITDENVSPLYAAVVTDSLKAAGFKPQVLVVAPGEGSKSLAIAEQVFTTAITAGLDRKSPIIALGGGVIGDLAGFAAATYLRGVPFVQVPTSLLAQVDSSVGGKTAVNHLLGKNLIGAFYQPQLVLIDPLVLNTLPERELKAGLAEVIKYGIIADVGFFAYLTCNASAILARDPAALTAVISRCCQLKVDVVARDERETSVRMLLNFGHTIAHAVEGVGGYAEYNHGEAVAIGMAGAALLSTRLGLCTPAASTAVQQLLVAMGLPLAAPGYGLEALLGYLARDKKIVDSKVNWILMEDIGRVIVTADVAEEQVRAVLQQITGPVGS